jgi:3-carboxy-cis,cis-muconate cycloisomerase
VTVPLTHAFATTAALAAIFSDRSVVQALLDVEVALANAQATLDVIPPRAAEAIARAARTDDFDAATIALEGRASASLAVPLVAALTDRVRALDEPASRFVHWGATSQDIVDTALVLLVSRAIEAMSAGHERLSTALRALSHRHATDLMVGRTLLQPAPPVTFGLKVAGWFAAEHRSWRRVVAAHKASAVVQLGGASGTLAALGGRGLDVASHMAIALGLGAPPAPWHTAHDALAALVAACGIYTGALGKMARDVSLLMQADVGEAFEPGGRSSTMPHKRNPAGCAVVLAGATRLPGLVSTMLSSLTHEHERALGGWQAEWPTVCDAIQTTGSALHATVGLAEGLTVDTARMRQNLEAVREAVLSERLMLRAGVALGRDRARALVREALAETGGGNSLADAIARRPELRAVLSDEDLRFDASAYLGEAETIRRRLLETD